MPHVNSPVRGGIKAEVPSARFLGPRAKQSKQDAQLSQRDRAAGCVIVFPKSRRLELGDNVLRTV